MADATPLSASVDALAQRDSAADVRGTAGAAEPEQRTLASGWRMVAAQAALMWLVTRIALAALTYFTILFATSGSYSRALSGTVFAPVPPHMLLSAWERWDVVPYLALARYGYTSPANAAFFPLYPLLAGVVSFLLGGTHSLLAALLVSNLGSLAAFVGLGLLAAHESEGSGSAEAARTLRVFAAYPFAFLLFAPYADGVFLGLAFFGLYCMRRRRWRWAALCVFLATLTRLTGLILVAPLVWEYIRARGWERGAPERARRIIARSEIALVALAGPAAVFLFAGYLAVRFGEPLAFLRHQSLYWDYTRPPIWASLPLGSQGFLMLPGWSYGRLLTVTSVALLAVLMLYALGTWRRMSSAFRLYISGLFLVCVAALVYAPDALRSPGAYLLAAAPLFILLGRASARRPTVDMLLVGCGFLLQAALALVWLAGLAPT